MLENTHRNNIDSQVICNMFIFGTDKSIKRSLLYTTNNNNNLWIRKIHLMYTLYENIVSEADLEREQNYYMRSFLIVFDFIVLTT